MKGIVFWVWMPFLVALIFSCSSPSGDRAQTGDAVESEVLTGENSFELDKGVIFWTGYGVGKDHKGTLDITEATLYTEGMELVGGEFIIDVNSLVVTDLNEDNGKSKLESHLKSGDFFESDKYPTGRFVITSISPVANKEGVTHQITGNLTLKDITKSITFDADIIMDNEEIRARTPDFIINRTEWNVMYGSDLIGTAKDKLISNDVTLSLGLNAKRKS